MKQLNLLPHPPSGKSGWPWTEESEPLSTLKPDGKSWPLISIVTPSFNQGQYIEETIRSILLQNYPSLEFIIIDGGSTDNTLEIIRKYEPWLDSWVSEPDHGQSHAINKGFKKCNGELTNWISSDDLLCKNALTSLAPQLAKNVKSFFIGKGIRINEKSQIIDEINPSCINSFEELIDIKNFWRKGNSIFQQATLYPLAEVRRIGFLNENNHFTMDYELWGELLISGIQVIQTPIPVGMFRWYQGQKTSNFKIVASSRTRAAISLVRKNRNLSYYKKLTLIYSIHQSAILFLYHDFRSFIGLKRRLKSLLHG